LRLLAATFHFKTAHNPVFNPLERNKKRQLTTAR
jgi:hypothetical protein